MAKPKAEATPPTRKAARQQIRSAPAAAPAKAKAPAKKPAKTRVRRSPTELLSDLTAQREEIAQKMGARIARLDEQIARTEGRYEKSLKLAEYADVDAEDLQRQFDEAKRQQKLLRLALKSKK